MEGILNLLRKSGYSESEIKKVLDKVPIDQQGKTGTNVSTGIFSKPKEGELSKDFLIVNNIQNPFEINLFKGSSRDDIIKSSETQLKQMDDELTKVASQILNQNLKLTDEQLSQFSKNIETKRRFEKDFEAFKSKPEGKVLDITTKEKVGDVEALKEKAGLVAPPTTDLGKIDLRNKLMIQKANELIESDVNFEKQEAQRQARIKKMYEGKGYEGGVFGPSGIYRSVGRDFLLDQNAKGIIKLDPAVVKSLENRDYISGGQALMYPDPIRIMRFHYGDEAFSKIPLYELSKTSGARSDILEAMSKVEIKPVQVEAPKTPGGYMTPGEIQANIEDLKGVEKLIKRKEGMFSDMTDQEIQRQSEYYGAQRGSFEMALQYDHPKAYEEYMNILSTRDYADGGRVNFAYGSPKESLGLDYLTGIERNYAGGGRIGFAEGTDDAPSITLDTHEKAPGNIDRYPIKIGRDVELGISGLMTEKNYQPNPYNKISGSERNISVRGKYNVPDTGVSIYGDIGDARTRSTQNINAPEFNQKETIRDVFKANPFSIGIGYAPDENKNIDLTYDDRGNVMLRGKYKFAKGGLGYLMGE